MKPDNLNRSVPAAFLCFAFWLLASAAMADETGSELPELRLSVLQFGTAHWELDHLQRRELDRTNGYRLVLQPVANLPASRLAVTSGSVDGAVADLLWAQARFKADSPYLYVPFSAQIGDIMVPAGSGISGVEDLVGKRVGVAGGPDSKGWVLLKQVALQRGIDLDAQTTVQYAAPPLLSQSLKRGQVDVIVTYWHFAARLKGEGGWRSAFAMADLLSALNLSDQLPVLGYVFPADWAEANRKLIDQFATSLKQAKTQLSDNREAWQPLRPLMKASSDSEFEALRQGFVAGTPGPMTAQQLKDLKQLLVLTGADPDRLMPDHLFYRDRSGGGET